MSAKPKFTFKKKPSSPETVKALDEVIRVFDTDNLVDVNLESSSDSSDFIPSRRKKNYVHHETSDDDEEEDFAIISETSNRQSPLDPEIDVVEEIPRTSRVEVTKAAWSGIMNKMRVQRDVKKKKETADAWSGLMRTMQNNQEKGISKTTSSKGKKALSSFSSITTKRQNISKKQPINPSKPVKRLKSGISPNNSSGSSSSFIKLSLNNNNNNSIKSTMDNDIITIEDEDMIEINKTSTTSQERQQQQQKLPVKLCPIFLPKSSNTFKASNGNDTQIVSNQLMQMQASGNNPWTTDNNTSDSSPQVVDINQDGNGNEIENEDETKKKTKNCPFYKKLPGTKFCVDAFDCGVIPGIDVYFLSHFHYDHYRGLTRKFFKTIICSSPTANLVKMKIGVADNCIKRLELNKPYIIQGSEVICIDANHCPGSVMFIITLPNGTKYLHTGDFRYTSDMLSSRFLTSIQVDCLYLDTTYCDPRYDFPKQCDSIAQAITQIKKHLAYRPKTLILCGSYVIGKERVFVTIAEALSTKVFVQSDKKRIINALENQHFKSILGNFEAECQIHVVQMNQLNTQALSEYLKQRSKYFSNIFALKPTGWEFSKGPGKSAIGSNVKSYLNDTVTIMGVPYSEHSSFSELQEFVTNIKPRKVQPTVGVGSGQKREAMMNHINSWLAK